jgi:hypothetical protein
MRVFKAHAHAQASGIHHRFNSCVAPAVPARNSDFLRFVAANNHLTRRKRMAGSLMANTAAADMDFAPGGTVAAVATAAAHGAGAAYAAAAAGGAGGGRVNTTGAAAVTGGAGAGLWQPSRIDLNRSYM